MYSLYIFFIACSTKDIFWFSYNSEMSALEFYENLEIIKKILLIDILSNEYNWVLCIRMNYIFQVLASASGTFGTSPSQICLWDMKEMTCKKVLSQHEYDIVKLSYSRDDRFLLSVG